ncbi:MAG: hypothetical protein M3Q29_04905 [Chloroflexota bacterium]|nr:hypothetical protein [Chloroflexota bacterium]
MRKMTYHALLALSLLLAGCGRSPVTPAISAVASPTYAAPNESAAASTAAPTESLPPTAAATSAPVNVTSAPAKPTAPPRPAPQELAFVRGGVVWSVPARGGEVRRLTTGKGASSPSWSPGGRAVAYIRLRGNSGGGALVLQLGGEGARELLPGGVTQLAWSPGGARLAYTRTKDRDGDGRLRPETDESSVWVTAAGTGSAARLAPGFDPSWAPDGRSVLLSTPGRLVQGVPEQNELRLYPASGGKSRTLSRTSDVPSDLRQYGTPFLASTRLLRYGVLSPDGETVAFSALGGVGVLATKELRGGKVQVQDTLPESGFGPIAWQPGGSRIAYDVPAPSGIDIVTVLDLASGNRRSFEGYRQPSWSPDGKSLAMVQTAEQQPRALVVVSPVELGRPRRVVAGEVYSPTWSQAP